MRHPHSVVVIQKLNHSLDVIVSTPLRLLDSLRSQNLELVKCVRTRQLYQWELIAL